MLTFRDAIQISSSCMVVVFGALALSAMAKGQVWLGVFNAISMLVMLVVYELTAGTKATRR